MVLQVGFWYSNMRYLILVIVLGLLLPIAAGEGRSGKIFSARSSRKAQKSKNFRTAENCALLENFNKETSTCKLMTALAVDNVVASAGDIVDIEVHGAINGESTFGVTIMVEILTRSDNEGDIWFTASVEDILQIGDPWFDIGVFSSYDIDLSGSDYLNGTVDDDGNYLSVPVVYSGPLSLFPVQVSEDANGVWDISLSTIVGDSDWEGVETVLRHGTVTIEE